MASKLLASLLTAATISYVFVDGVSAKTQSSNRKHYYPRRMNRGFDDRMIKPTPQIGDEKMVRKAPQNIDDGIFKPRRVFKTFKRKPATK